MNAFAIAAMALLLGFVPLGIVILRERIVDTVVALELAGAVLTLVLICLSESFHRSSYFDLPVISALLTFVGGLVFVRFLGRWL